MARMNYKILRNLQKSLRRIAESRYNGGIESCVRAPQGRLFLFSPVLFTCSRGNKPIIFSSLHTLGFYLRASPPFSMSSTLFAKHRGVYPKASRFGTGVIEPAIPRSCSRSRFPAHRLFDQSWRLAPSKIGPIADGYQIEAGRFSLAGKKQSVPNWAHSAETPAQLTTFTKYSVTPYRSSGDRFDEARALSH